jgi:hypothetical protein
MSRFPFVSKTEIVRGMIAVAVVLAALVLWQAGRTSRTLPVSEIPPAVAPVAAPVPAKTEPVVGKPVETFAWFQKRPFSRSRTKVGRINGRRRMGAIRMQS